MTRTVGIYEAKTNLSRLVEAVERGEEIIISRNGVPCARLTSIPPAGPIELGFLLVNDNALGEYDSAISAIDDDEWAEWEAEVEEFYGPAPSA